MRRRSANATAMDIENKDTPSAVSAQSPVPSTDTGTQHIGDSHSDMPRGPPLSIMGLEGVIKDGHTPESTTKGYKAGYTHMASDLADDFGRHHLVVFPNPKEIPTLKGSILVPEENTKTEIRSGARVTKYDLSNQGLDPDSTERPVDRIDVSLSYNKPPTEKEVASMVSEHVRNLCHHWRRVKINIHQGEVPTEGSKEPDYVVSQA
jgi:hypothetical protein